MYVRAPEGATLWCGSIKPRNMKPLIRMLQRIHDEIAGEKAVMQEMTT